MLTSSGLFILQHFLYISCLRTVITDGPAHCLKGELAEPDVTIHLQNHRLFWRILIKPDLAIGKAYMDSKNSAVCRNMSYLLEIFNFPRSAKRNVANHYDLTDSLFDQFLDRRRQYSCGYFYMATDTFANAQITKLAHLEVNRCIPSNHKALDIGTKWGGAGAFDRGSS